MTKLMIASALPALAALAFSPPTAAQQESEPVAASASPSEIVNAAGQEDWKPIAPDALLVMTLAGSANGAGREVIIQLLPAPLSEGWTGNIRALAKAGWYDGTSINRVQDNYVVQWGDPNYDNPESSGKAKSLPDGLKAMTEGQYLTVQNGWEGIAELGELMQRGAILNNKTSSDASADTTGFERPYDLYAEYAGFVDGWPVAFGSAFTAFPGDLVIPEDVAQRMIQGMRGDAAAPLFGALSEDEGQEARRIASKSLTALWPVHCYGMVGVGRNLSPDTGTGAELYTVIGHAPRHLDRNIALVGRVISGMQHLSSLPRGNGALGFYTSEEARKRTPIVSIRLASDLPEDDRPQFEYLSTASGAFARYVHARANRSDPFFIAPANGADLCNVPVPVRPFEYNDDK